MGTENTTVGMRLRQERKRLAMTQAALAEFAGIGKASQLAYEAGSTDPGVSYLLKIAEAGVDVFWVLTGEPIEAAAWRRFNTKLIVEVVLAVEQWAVTRGKQTSLETKAHLVRVIVQQCNREGVLDAPLVEDLLKIAG